MKDRSFDDHIKQSLNKLEEPYDPGSWDLLQQKMDASIGEEVPEPVADVDKAVYHTLSRMEAGYQPGDWAKMSAVLDGNRKRRKVFWLKLTEAAAVLLLLFGIDSYSEYRSGQPIRRLNPNVPIAAAGMPGDKGSVNHTFSNASANAYGDARAHSYSAAQALPGRPVALISQNQQDIASRFPYSSRIVNAAPSTSFDPVPTRVPELSRNKVQPKAPIVTIAPRKSNWYVLNYAAAEQNKVRIAGQVRNSRGYGAGVLLGFRQKRWGVEAGAGYAHRSYEPKLEIEIYDGNINSGYYGIGTTKVEADLVSIPVRITREIAQRHKTSILAVAGVSAHLALQKTFKTKTFFFPGSAPSGIPGAADQQTVADRYNAKGILEGGQLKRNVYASADIGVRVEHRIGKRYNAFIEPSYRRQISSNGIGTSNTGINTIGVSAGVIAFL